MGKIKNGCDIVFMINGDYENAIRMGSDLSSELISYRAIANVLMNEFGKKELLRNALKLLTMTRLVTLEDVSREGVVHNCTVANIAKMYPDRNWSDVDQSTKLLATTDFLYYGKHFNNVLIKLNGETIIVIDPYDTNLIDTLYNYLKAKNKIKHWDDTTKDIVQQLKIKDIVEQLPDVIKPLLKASDTISELEKQTPKENYSDAQLKKLILLADQKNQHEKFVKYTPKDVISLLYDYLEDSTKYFGLYYKDGNKIKSITTQLENTIKTLLGKTVRAYNYNDIFANEVSGRSKYNSNTKLSAITKHEFIEILQVKLADLTNKINSLNSYGLDGEIKNRLKILKNNLENFLNKNNKTTKDWNDIINELINSTDDEFSYKLLEMDNTYIYLKNVPMLLEDRYNDFTYKSVEMLKPIEEYKGHTIYVDSTGKKYYFSRHILTTKSYGQAYKTIDECKNKIDLSNFNNPINLLSLIEFKFKNNDVVYLPNKFIPGLVIKVLYSDKLQFSTFLLLNKAELALIYDTGINNRNNLRTFYKYIIDIVNYNSEAIAESLEKHIDTAEKAACFIYKLNQDFGTVRNKITKEQFDNILSVIKEATYKYYVVEEVGDLYKGSERNEFKIYHKNTKDNNLVKGVYKTVVTEILPNEISDLTVLYDQNSGRLIPTIRLLRDLSLKLEDKLGIKVHIETQSTLEDLFKEWGEEMPSQVNGFIKNGEIYINSSVVSINTLFHEFTHIMLGVLKAKNFDNYYDLVNIVASKKTREKELIRKRYPNRADSDINEELFADLFALHIMGKDLGNFLNYLMEDARKVINDKMESIFGKEKLSEEFYDGKLANIFLLFGHDLGLLIKLGNGLEIDASNYREASNWIESQIAEHKDDNSIGILEKCE